LKNRKLNDGNVEAAVNVAYITIAYRLNNQELSLPQIYLSNQI